MLAKFFRVFNDQFSPTLRNSSLVMALRGPTSSLGAGKSEEDEYAKRFKINQDYLSKDFQEYIRSGIKGKNENSYPFPHFQLNNFIEDIGLVGSLEKELKSAPFFRNENDLYSLSQTIDLKLFDVEKYPFLRGFRRFMSTTVRDFLSNITGFELNTQVAITGSRYSQSDLLLPHDDSLDFRKIAFVLYLTPDWKEEYGGELALFNADPNTNRPTTIAKNLQPTYNSLMFFPVATNTWHSVREVFSPNHQRLSLNGWFHADEAKAADPPKPEPPIKRIKPTLETTLSDVNLWINSSYIIPSEQKAIKRRFAAKSELYLEKFLNQEMYQAALEQLKSASFKDIGPPDRRNVSVLVESELSSVSPLAILLNLFRSEAITLLLTQWSGLKIYDLDKLSDPSSPSAKKPRFSTDSASNPSTSVDISEGSKQETKSIEMVSNIYRFEHGKYTMADQQLVAESNGYCLDVLLFFGEFETWPADVGGFISYIAVEDTQEILKVPPRPNCLAIVFREPEILNFTKYINCLADSAVYYVLNCSFFGAAFEDDNESESSLESDAEDHEDFDIHDSEFEDEEGPENEFSNEVLK